MMLDADIVAVRPSSVWRVLSQGGLLLKWNGKLSKKGTGFEQPLALISTGTSTYPISTSAVRSTTIRAERDRKLEAARQQRQSRRQQAA
jgi:hypothetical protein